LEALFEPDWQRIDAPRDSRWEKIDGRWVLRGREDVRKAEREAYAERRRKNWMKLLREK
jgi:hypothetical protein